MKEVLKLALEALSSGEDMQIGRVVWTEYDSSLVQEAIVAIKEALAQPEQCQCPNCKVTLHASDCAVHSGPAYPAGGCDCGAQQGPAIGDIRALKHRIHELEGEVIGYKQILDAQPEQEPMHPELRKMWEDYFDKCFRRNPLTDKQILADETLRYYFGQNGGAGPVSKQGRKVVNAIEALHGIKELKSCGS